MKNERLMSLDALRGADMLCIMGLSGAIMAFCSWIGMKDCWLATQMTHVDWHGFLQHDTIFPLFLFLAGASWPFSFAGQVKRGYSTGRIVLRCPMIPGLNDADADLAALGRLADSLKGVERIDVEPYVPFGINKAHRLGLKVYEAPMPPPDYADAVLRRLRTRTRRAVAQ